MFLVKIVHVNFAVLIHVNVCIIDHGHCKKEQGREH